MLGLLRVCWWNGSLLSAALGVPPGWGPPVLPLGPARWQELGAGNAAACWLLLLSSTVPKAFWV